MLHLDYVILSLRQGPSLDVMANLLKKLGWSPLFGDKTDTQPQPTLLL